MPRLHETSALAVAWATFQRRPRVRGLRPTWPWAARLGGQIKCHVNAVWAGREPGCRWSFGPLPLICFSIFLNIFKSLQIQKFV
jgi:hypothetical protein